MLDLREVSAFFSRDTGRCKSTLCKLYQIARILGALGIIQRTENVCEVKVMPPFRSALVALSEVADPLAIESLLNRPVKSVDGMAKRRAEYGRFMRGASTESEGSSE
jgi:hypothetical protein